VSLNEYSLRFLLRYHYRKKKYHVRACAHTHVRDIYIYIYTFLFSIYIYIYILATLRARVCACAWRGLFSFRAFSGAICTEISRGKKKAVFASVARHEINNRNNKNNNRCDIFRAKTITCGYLFRFACVFLPLPRISLIEILDDIFPS